MPQQLKSHADARFRLGPDVCKLPDYRALAEAAEARYRAVVEQHLRGHVSSHALLVARVSMMEAWSRWVEHRQRAQQVRDLPVVRVA